MSRRNDDRTNRPSDSTPPADRTGRTDRPSTPKPRNAFAPEFLDERRRRDHHPATPDADFAGPWRVVPLHGNAPSEGDAPLRKAVRWGCFAAGEDQPRMVFREPDLAFLAAAALAVTERPERFRLEKGDDGRMHLLHDGFPVATAAWPIAPGCNLPSDLSRLADLRVQPRALAHLLLSVPDEVLERVGVMLMRVLAEPGE